MVKALLQLKIFLFPFLVTICNEYLFLVSKEFRLNLVKGYFLNALITALLKFKEAKEFTLML